MAKITIKLKKRLANRSKETPERNSSTGDLFEEFSSEVRSTNRQKGVVQDWWRKTFEEKMPQDKPLELLKLKLSYELLHRDYVSKGLPIPERVRSNYEASQEYNIDGLTDGLKQMILISLSHEDGSTDNKSGEGTKEESMVKKAVKKEEVKGVVKKEKVFESFIRIFTANFKNKLTDEQLAKEMQKAHPDKKETYDAKYMNFVRGVFNRGKLTSQKEAPKKALPAFDKKGEEISRAHKVEAKKTEVVKKAKKVKEANSSPSPVEESQEPKKKVVLKISK